MGTEAMGHCPYGIFISHLVKSVHRVSIEASMLLSPGTLDE